MITGVLEDEVIRMAEAMAAGHHADCLFARVCRSLGLDPDKAIAAPLLTVGMIEIQPEGHA